ncbi:MAG: flagellin [Nitrospinota bacterium]
MAIRVFSNLFSVNAQRNLGNNNEKMRQSLERLSSGLRINRAADDAAGLAISEKLRSDIRAIGQAIRNSNDGISIVNTTEGALNAQSVMLTRMRELSAQAATGSVGSTERATINAEFTALRNEIDRIMEVTEFNGQKLINGSLRSGATTDITIQVGFKNTTNDRISLNTSADLTIMSSTALQIDTLSVTAAAEALTALNQVQSALNTVTSARGRLGAVQNRFVNTVSNLQIASENLQAAESQIRDADYAAEISQFTRNQILVQASTSILAQANSVPQSVLQLLG